MNKNGESYSSVIESYRKSARYKRLLIAQRGSVDTCFESNKISRRKTNVFDEPIPNDPTQVLQLSPWRQSNVSTKVKQIIKNFTAINMQK